MAKETPLVCQQIENISLEGLEKFQKVKGLLNPKFSNLFKLLRI